MIDEPARILLLGAGGQVGCVLAKSLASLGQVVPTVRSATSVPALQGARILDVADLTRLRDFVLELRPQLIVNATGYTAVDRAETEPELATRLNREVPRCLAEAAVECSAALVHFSTDYVFDGSGQRPWHEDDPVAPLNVYGQTKAAGEQAIAATDCPHLIVRTSWVYGAHGSNFVKTMLRLGREREQLRVVADQIGAPTSATVISDIVTKILASSIGRWSEVFSERGGLLHVTCQQETTWHGFASEIFSLARSLGWPLVVKDLLAVDTATYAAPARRPLNSRLDGSLLRERFGLSTPDWRAALAADFAEIVRAC